MEGNVKNVYNIADQVSFEKQIKCEHEWERLHNETDDFSTKLTHICKKCLLLNLIEY